MLRNNRKEFIMWVLEKDGKQYTCPKNNLYTLVLMHQMDRGIMHGDIHDDLSAKEVLENNGFVITEVEEPQDLTDIPKVAQWYNRQHRELYDKLFYSKLERELTKEEEEFVKQMYHQEEYACGLDGDR